MTLTADDASDGQVVLVTLEADQDAPPEAPRGVAMIPLDVFEAT